MRLMAALSAFCIMAATAPARAQNAQADPSTSAHSASSPSPGDELMARASKLYYSTTKAGLDSFVCEVHPDWHTIFVSANKNAPIGGDDPRIILLKSIEITLHGRLKGGSTVDWTPPANPDSPIDADTTRMLDSMHNTTNQSLQGFMQFWTPFVDGSAIPDSAEGVEIAKTEKGHTIHASLSGTSLTESLDDSLILQRFDVVSGGMTVHFAPSFKPTSKGLLVNAFHAHIQPPGIEPDQAQEINVEIEYQPIHGFPIPARINIQVVNSGTFNLVLDGCSVNQ
jgi:hypothetical protein